MEVSRRRPPTAATTAVHRSLKRTDTFSSDGKSRCLTRDGGPLRTRARRNTASSRLTRTSMVVTAVLSVCCRLSAPLQADAFFIAPTTPALRFHGIVRVAGEKRTTMMAGKGFGKSIDTPPGASAITGAATGGGVGGGGGGGATSRDGGGGGVESWEKEYKAYIKRTGQYLCSMSWEGHEEMGRGAIFANYDDARQKEMLDDTDKFGGIPSMYVPLTEFESMTASGQAAGEGDDLAQIVQRVKGYRPEKEFVVVFQAAGVMGADIVRPNVSPPEMAKHVVKSEGVSTMPSATGLDGVIDVN